MRIVELLGELRARDIELWADGGTLRYSAPAGVLTPDLRALLADRKAELLGLLRRIEVQAPAISQVSREGALPVSFAQERLWFLDQLEPGSAAYNIPMALRLKGRLNIEALERSLNEILRRHESLRTVFVARGGEPFQKIAPTLCLQLRRRDLTGMPGDEQEAMVRRLLAEEGKRPFDLCRGPLVRGALLRLDEEHHILLLTMHHIISDGWSIGIFYHDFSTLYEAFRNGRPSPLPELPIQYADFAVWQRSWLQGDVLEAEISYWRDELAGAPPLLDLPTDRRRPTVQSFPGAQKSDTLPAALSQQLRALSRHEGATLFMTLLAAFKVLLHRYTGMQDILVGTPIANRNRVEIESLIGFFANTLVLRGDLSGDPTFRDLLARVSQVCLDAYAHQDLPFEKLVAELQPERSLSYAPLFQVMFALQNVPQRVLELSGLEVSWLATGSDTAKFDLSVLVSERGSALRALWEYNTDLFYPGTIDRMMGHYRTLLEGVVADPDQCISSLQLLTEAERRLLTVGWNDTRVDYPEDMCVHQLFEAQVARAPEAIAVEVGQRQATYRELNGRANRLAHWLKGQGVGPDVLVGICVERSLEMLVGMLGILKAGGACVPLDPVYPSKRLAFMLEDTDAPVLLTQKRLRDTFPDYAGRLVQLDTDWEAIAEASEENPASQAIGGHLVYVLYTSGSTGRPKGVALPHRALANLIHWQLENTTVPGPTRMLQYSPLSFDASFTDIFMALCAGSTLVVVPEAVRREMVELAGFIASRECQRLNLSSVVLLHLSEAIDSRGLAPLGIREVISTADQLRVTPSLRKLFGQMPDCTLQNQYGPTETHVVTAFRLSGDASDWPTLPPVGRPISNTRVYILDDHLQPVPIGVVGKLYIGGRCLARGYLNRPDLTRERFVPDPFSKDPDARLYVTGDLARYLSDGNIEFLGRVDHQVKIRAYRVEPGEVEAALGKHPSVRQVVVAAKAGQTDGHSAAPGGDRRLVAYIVPEEGPAPTATELRGFLKERLPEYLVPSAFVVLGALPLTPSGKVDRLALPTPDGARPELRELYVAPRTPVEEALAGIWTELLGVEPIGIHDNFFELGGHSLLATQVISRIRTALRVELPLRRMFEMPTVAGFAACVERIASIVSTPEPPTDLPSVDREEVEL